LITLLIIVEARANPLSFPDASNRRNGSPYEGRTYDSQGREITGNSDTSARSLTGYQSNRNQIDISQRPNSDFNRLLNNRQPFALKYDEDDYDDAALPDKPENAYSAYNRPQSGATGYTNSKYGGAAYDDDYEDTEERLGHKFKKGKHKRKKFQQSQPCIPVPFGGGNSYRSNARDVGSGRTLPLFNIYYNQPYGGGGYPAGGGGYQDPSSGSNRPQYSHTGGYLCVPQYGGGGGGGGFGGGPLGFFGQGGLFDFTSSGVAPQRPQRPISSSSGDETYNDGVSGGSYRPPIADIVQSAGGNVVSRQICDNFSTNNDNPNDSLFSHQSKDPLSRQDTSGMTLFSILCSILSISGRNC
jgi:hypothetical protein